MKELYEKLKKKGWDEDEIRRALNILKYGKSTEKNYYFYTKKMTYWAALIFLILINMILSVMFVPFLIVGKHTTIYLLIILLAAGLGYIFTFLLKDIQRNDPQHHIIAGIFMPTIALINIYIVVNLTNYFIILTEFKQELYSPILVTALYVISFMAPYTIIFLSEKKAKKSIKKSIKQ